ncbi:unnamed protein product [Rotaria sordida]|nr:unnamed protein product [Rotaria sordida]CAF3874877.1 unnamed protein product [Rotaria sordida]CAF3942176.1 unnamed protein product [Rotaria sordida]
MPKQTIDMEDHTNRHDTLNGGHTTFNNYATKKTLANSSIEIALLVTNAVQLKTLLGNQTNQDTLWYVGLALVCISLLIQVVNACILVLLGTNDISKERRQHRLISLNNFSLILSVLLAIVNVVLNVIVAVDPKIFATVINGTKSA